MKKILLLFMLVLSVASFGKMEGTFGVKIQEKSDKNKISKIYVSDKYEFMIISHTEESKKIAEKSFETAMEQFGSTDGIELVDYEKGMFQSTALFTTEDDYITYLLKKGKTFYLVAGSINKGLDKAFDYIEINEMEPDGDLGGIYITLGLKGISEALTN